LESPYQDGRRKAEGANIFPEEQIGKMGLSKSQTTLLRKAASFHNYGEVIQDEAMRTARQWGKKQSVPSLQQERRGTDIEEKRDPHSL